MVDLAVINVPKRSSCAEHIWELELSEVLGEYSIGNKRLIGGRASFILHRRLESACDVDRNVQGSVSHVKETEAAASRLGVQLQSLDVGDEKGLENAFQAAGKGRAQAIVIVGTGFMNIHMARIANLAMKSRLPAIYTGSQFVTAGGLMSYGADADEQFHGAATYVDKILKGAKPADLPVQQPTKFEFLINLKAAKALGFKIPGLVLVQATRVIE